MKITAIAYQMQSINSPVLLDVPGDVPVGQPGSDDGKWE